MNYPYATAFDNYSAAVAAAFANLTATLATIDPIDIVPIDIALETYVDSRRLAINNFNADNTAADRSYHQIVTKS